MSKKTLLSFILVCSMGALFSFQVKRHTSHSNVKSTHVNQLKPLAEVLPKIKIKVGLGAPQTDGNECHGNATCGPCFGICVKIIIAAISQDLSGYPGLETIGEYVDDTHFKISFSNVDAPQIVNNNTVVFSQNNLLDEPIIMQSYNKASIQLMAGTYPIFPGENNTSYVIVNSVSN